MTCKSNLFHLSRYNDSIAAHCAMWNSLSPLAPVLPRLHWFGDVVLRAALLHPQSQRLNYVALRVATEVHISRLRYLETPLGRLSSQSSRVKTGSSLVYKWVSLMTSGCPANYSNEVVFQHPQQRLIQLMGDGLGPWSCINMAWTLICYDILRQIALLRIRPPASTGAGRYSEFRPGFVPNYCYPT